jgi:cysteine synthase A
MSNDKDIQNKKIKSEMHFRGKIYESILGTIGATPLVRLSRFKEKYELYADILAKLEYFNPMASVKDRAGLAMIEAAEQTGQITPGKTTIIEPTSGNTGIALAFVCAYKGYRLILTMPESMSIERRKMLRYLGADVELTPAKSGMRGAIDRAQELIDAEENAFCPSQFENAANPQIHSVTTAEEIWADTNGNVDIFISGVGTGGTLTGNAQTLKAYNPAIKIVAVEPDESAVISGEDAGTHGIQGIGAGFIPGNLNVNFIDEVQRVNTQSAIDMAKELATLEGIPCGISSGAALEAAKIIGKRPKNKGKQLVIIIPSFAERYLSSPLFDGVLE